MDNHAALAYESARVYCNDGLLSMLQMAPWRPFKDSKTMVDLPLRVHPDLVIDAFDKLGDHPPENLGRKFLKDNFFDAPEDDVSIVNHIPTDYTEGPPLALDHTRAHDFSADLKARWLHLCRRFRSSSPDPRSSLIPLPHSFFVPGGRFRECYYWDTLWIVHGLISSDMLTSAIGVVRNLLHLADKLGFVPNGNRVYYLNRSQPPVLPDCVRAVFEALPTQREKRDWLEEALPVLEKEYRSFMECRRHPPGALPNNAQLAVFRVNTSKPRPESYSEDIHTATEAILKRSDSQSSLSGEEFENAKPLILDMRRSHLDQVYQDIASGAESGWDFTSRWLRDHTKGLSTICTTKIVPACLNSVLLRDEKLIAEFHIYLAGMLEYDEEDRRNQHLERAQEFKSAAARRTVAMNTLMWSPTHRMWMDYDMKLRAQTSSITIAGLMPLWAHAWEGAGWTVANAASVVDELMNRSGLVAEGGIACTSNRSDEQWDFPNMWTPLVDLAISGLRDLEAAFPGCGAAAAAEEIAMRTLRSLHQGWLRDGVMHEKYDASFTDGRRGERGEYEPQEGFGWTNGVALKLMTEYISSIENANIGDWLS